MCLLDESNPTNNLSNPQLYHPVKTKKQHMTPLQGLIFGVGVVLCETPINHPFFVGKIRSQNKMPLPSYNILKISNLMKWYRGLSPRTLGLMAIAGSQVSWYASLLRIFVDKGKKPTPLQNMAIAFSSGFCSSVFASPAEQLGLSQNYKRGNLWNTIRRRIERRGVRGLFTGFVGTGLRDGFFTYTYLRGANRLDETIQPYLNSIIPSPVISFAAKPLAGAASAFLAQPFDTGKTKQQGLIRPKSLIKTIHNIVKKEGIIGLYKGYPQHAAQVALAITIYSTAFNRFTSFLEQPSPTWNLSSWNFLWFVRFF